ncbi:hypothetical protein D051_0116 [Vibrio parahaemolyticus VPCR-2010]|nr:hypothetical protein D051_0116 [Vibrio parahaemolyticus VPCR-2010]
MLEAKMVKYQSQLRLSIFPNMKTSFATNTLNMQTDIDYQ